MLARIPDMNYEYRADPNVSTLAQEVEMGDCVVFSGAGISIPSGLPSWPDLQQMMKSKAQLRYEYSALRTADCCRQVLGNQIFSKMLVETVKKARRPNEIHQKIADLPAKIFATSNFDVLLERAIRDAGEEPRVLSLNESTPWLHIPDSPSEPYVLKIHGCVDRCRDSLMISEEDFLLFATKYHDVVKGLHEVLARHSILFLGYSLSDWDLLNVLQQSRHDLDDDVPNRYFVGFSLELPMRRFLEQRYKMRVFDLELLNRVAPVDKTKALIQFLDDLIARFRIPRWLTDMIAGLGGRVDERASLDATVISLFPGFDVSAAVRLAVRIQAEQGIAVPVEPLATRGMTLRELLQVINEAEQEPPRTVGGAPNA